MPKGISACMTCPACGGLMSLENHEIDEKGIVSPSVVAPNESACSVCHFHDFLVLENWLPVKK